MQIAARFELSVDGGTRDLCRVMILVDLPPERIWGELEKLLLLAARPSIGPGRTNIGVSIACFRSCRRSSVVSRSRSGIPKETSGSIR